MNGTEARLVDSVAPDCDAWRKLSPKQRAFVVEYAACSNAVVAARRAGYRRARPATILSMPNVSEAIDAVMAKRIIRAGVDVDEVVKELATVAFSRDGSVSNRDKLKALELLARHLGMFDDKLRVSIDREAIEILAEREGLSADIIEGEYRALMGEMEASARDDASPR